MPYNGKDVQVFTAGQAVSNSNRLPVSSTLSGGVLVTEAFDYVEAAYPAADTEEYTYKTGGSGGTTVATVTVVYTDNTKEFISTVTRT